jgi:hypothetical protein
MLVQAIPGPGMQPEVVVALVEEAGCGEVEGEVGVAIIRRRRLLRSGSWSC